MKIKYIISVVVALVICVGLFAGVWMYAWNLQDAPAWVKNEVDTEFHEISEIVTEVPKINERYLTKDERLTVCLDPGHGGSDNGAEGLGYVEKEQTLELCLLIKKYLEPYDVEVIMTRETDVEMTKTERPIFANANYADVLVSVHRNNFYSSKAYGFEIWIGKTDKEEDRRLAQLIMDNLCEVEGTYNRGIELGSTTDRNEDYYVNRYSLMPSCLIEMGFISNKSDNKLLVDNMEEYAKLIAEAILTFLEVDLGDEE